MTSAQKKGNNELEVKYDTYTETIQLQTFGDKSQPHGPHFIQEQVNGSFCRFYELAAVKNRPYILRVTLYSQVNPALFTVKGKTALSTLASLTNYLNQLSRPHLMPNISDVQDGDVPMIIEDDDSMADDNVKDAEELEEEEKKSEALIVPGKTPGGDMTDAQTLELIKTLGPFESSPAVLEKPLPNPLCITNWSALYHRYKPENIPYLNKALKAKGEFEQKLPLADWKVSVDDKKEGLMVWVRTTAEGLNGVKA